MTTPAASERVGGIFALAGAAVLLATTLLHPATADPSDAAVAFAEYAASDLWVAAHVGQLLGFALLGAALVALAGTLPAGYGAALGRIGAAGAIAMIAVAAVLQAVDGVALKVAVDRWAVAVGEARTRAFEAAFAVRQVEIALAAVLSLLTGATLIAISAAVLAARRHPRWFGALGVIGAVGAIAAGYGYAVAGFSTGPMLTSTIANVLLLAWAAAASTLMLTGTDT